MAVRLFLGFIQIRRQWPFCEVNWALEFRSWCYCSVRSLEVSCLKVEAVLFWADIDQALSTVGSASTLECQRATDVHFEIAGAEKADPWSLLFGLSPHLFDGADDQSVCVCAEKEVEEGDDHAG